MSDLAYTISVVKDTVTCMEIAERAGLTVRNGRCRCPVHNGTDYNCKLDGKRPGYYCFTCGASGDQIDFTEHALHVDFPDALKWIIDTFHIAVPEPTFTGDYKEVRRQRERLERQRLYQKYIDLHSKVITDGTEQPVPDPDDTESLFWSVSDLYFAVMSNGIVEYVGAADELYTAYQNIIKTRNRGRNQQTKGEPAQHEQRNQTGSRTA